MDGKEILKQPLETAISIHIEDFEDFHAEEDIHITISVKDFKAIVTHAETLKGPITTYFSRPSRPLQFFYQTMGMTCQFTLMTRGDNPSPSATPAAHRAMSTLGGSKQSSRQASLAPIALSGQSGGGPTPEATAALQTTEVVKPPTRQATEMRPPPKPVTLSALRDRRQLNTLGRATSQATTTSERDSESLFVPRYDDDERRWDPPDFEREEPDEMLGWDANADIVSSLTMEIPIDKR